MIDHVPDDDTRLRDPHPEDPTILGSRVGAPHPTPVTDDVSTASDGAPDPAFRVARDPGEHADYRVYGVRSVALTTPVERLSGPAAPPPAPRAPAARRKRGGLIVAGIVTAAILLAAAVLLVWLVLS